ncbi:MAG TPA: Ig-like domain-containing protein, partial [Thermoanaerobaculia bacterium]
MRQFLIGVYAFALVLAATAALGGVAQDEFTDGAAATASPQPRSVSKFPVAETQLIPRADVYSTKINNTLTVAAPGVLSNDSGVNSAILEHPANHGNVTLSASGGFTYVPFTDFVGTDWFTYRALLGQESALPVQVIITVYSTASAAVTGPGNICVGEGAVLNVGLAGDPPFKVYWDDGLISTTSATNLQRQVQPGASTWYGITKIEDKNGPGRALPSSVTVMVNSRPPTPSILGDSAVETNESLTLMASTLNSSYQWYRNGVPIVGAMDRTFNLASATSGDEGLYTVTARLGSCDSLHSVPVFVDVATRRVIPVIGSANGAYASMFRSSIQIHNRAAEPIGGTIDFYGPESGAPLQTAYGIDPRGTASITNVQSILGEATLGSIDITAPLGPVVPDTVVRVYNDGGPLGTTGVTVPQVRMKDVLRPGERAVLIGPGDLDLFRFNIGIRTLEEGVEMNVRSYAADGDLRMLVRRWFPGNSFRQLRADDLAGLPLTENGVMTFEVLGGAAVIYGVAVEN